MSPPTVPKRVRHGARFQFEQALGGSSQETRPSCPPRQSFRGRMSMPQHCLSLESGRPRRSAPMPSSGAAHNFTKRMLTQRSTLLLQDIKSWKLGTSQAGHEGGPQDACPWPFPLLSFRGGASGTCHTHSKLFLLRLQRGAGGAGAVVPSQYGFKKAKVHGTR